MSVFKAKFEQQLRNYERKNGRYGSLLDEDSKSYSPTVSLEDDTGFYDESSSFDDSSFSDSTYSDEYESSFSDFTVDDDVIHVGELSGGFCTCSSAGNLNLMEESAATSIATPALKPRRASVSGRNSNSIVYAVQTASAIASLPHHADATPMPQDVFEDMLWENGQEPNFRPYTSWNDWRKGDVKAYTIELVTAVRQDRIDVIHRLHREGQALQCANQFGESIVHIVARRGRKDILQFMVERADVSMRVCCDWGRTPLHDACWTADPEWDCVRYILSKHPDFLFVQDRRGFTPLDYIPRDQHAAWGRFLREHEELLAMTPTS